ncbi:DUF5655 domain-containing protein [Rufibacter sediminis]|uniref:DUF5655 domain-containing protein n=1 Tax=Rufibacter sediminis TaxID=2762756 RepID=A0ABR6VSI1_9BACT|nr:DUF5655 domain-containing protein [Rufibacter sediminis]MBC3540115.1 hypothetical protein [Rufibacter sediminis]
MWTCPTCTQQFLRNNQAHSCLDKTEADFLRGKSEKTLSLYHHFLEQYRTIGDFRMHPSKSMLSLAKNTRFCMIYKLGRNFIDIYIPLNKVYADTLCFHKIGQIGEKQTNHWLRLYEPEDINEEVLHYMRLAYEADAEKGRKSK